MSAEPLDSLSDFLGLGAKPPESVARKVLGIGTTLPLSREGVRAAFRFRVKLLRPDLSDAAADDLRLRDVTPEAEAGRGGELRFDSGSTEERASPSFSGRARTCWRARRVQRRTE